jgi:hypothetical protein
MEHVLVCIVPKLRQWSFPGGLGDQGEGPLLLSPPFPLVMSGPPSFGVVVPLENLWNCGMRFFSTMEDINLVDEVDQIIWSLCSDGKFAVQSLYVVINHRGVTPVYVQAVVK